jgi:hypothetical protein
MFCLTRLKTVTVAFGRMRGRCMSSVCVDKQPIPWVDQFYCLGVVFNAHGALTVDVLFTKRQFYAALNSLLVSY